MNNYTSKINDTDMFEYTDHLLSLLDTHDVYKMQYVLDKASQMGIIELVIYIITQSKKNLSNLHINNALLNATLIGHIEIVEFLLEHDFDNEGDNLNGETTNIPLTQKDIENAIKQSILANHSEIHKILEGYYYKTYVMKKVRDALF
jgi:ankyrin repeat protein